MPCGLIPRQAASIAALLPSLLLCQPSPTEAGGAGPALLRLDGSRVPIAEIERRIPELMASVWLPGMSVAVVRDGAIDYSASFGLRDAGTSEPITAATCFTGLSFSKTITAYLVMRLVERGELDLDVPLHSYLARPLPEYEFYADLKGDPRYRQITARHVLSHTTGWPNWRWLTDSGTLRFLFEPGTRHSYSGEGFAFLQLALEELTGRDFATLAREEVFAPLAMSSSSMVWEAEYELDYAQDHDFLGRALQRDRRDTPSAAGSLQTTLADYTRFLMAVLGSQGLDPASRDLMLSPQVSIRHARMFGPRLHETTSAHEETQLSWTLGWGSVSTPSGPAFFHTGNDRGSANYAIAFPDRRAAVVLMGNSNRLEGIAEDVVALLTSDHSSPFDFLGYERWDSSRQTWLRTLVKEGALAGRAYWENLGATRAHHALDRDEAFGEASEAIALFGTLEDSIAFLNWRRQLFPSSPAAVRDLVKRLLAADHGADALAELEAIEREASELAPELAWFSAWVRTLDEPMAVSVADLTPLAGAYGPRRFELREGRLFYGRDASEPGDYGELLAMGGDTFVLRAYDFFRLRFERDETGRAIRVHGLYEDGRTDSNDRSHD